VCFLLHILPAALHESPCSEHHRQIIWAEPVGGYLGQAAALQRWPLTQFRGERAALVLSLTRDEIPMNRAVTDIQGGLGVWR
jgi:hypothetical protein